MESNNNLSAHRKMVDSSEFQRGEDFAMRQYTAEQMLRVSDGNTAASAGLKILGAHEFMQTFRLLSEAVRVSATPKIVDHLPEPN